MKQNVASLQPEGGVSRHSAVPSPCEKKSPTIEVEQPMAKEAHCPCYSSLPVRGLSHAALSPIKQTKRMFPVKVTFALLSPIPFLEVGSRLP